MTSKYLNGIVLRVGDWFGVDVVWSKSTGINVICLPQYMMILDTGWLQIL